MSLTRQLTAWLIGLLLLAVAVAVTVHLASTHRLVQQQLHLKNQDAAQVLALAASQQQGDGSRIGLLMRAQADTGHYRRIVWQQADGRLALDLQGPAPSASGTPDWFERLLPLRAEPGVAQISDGWRALGQVTVDSHAGGAHRQLWRAAWQVLAWMTALGLAAGALAAWWLGRLHRALGAAVTQSEALAEGRYLQVDEPRTTELRRLASAGNRMVGRVRDLFETQQVQNEALRRAAFCDGLTGLPHRAHFLERLGAAMEREDGLTAGGFVLLRLADMATLNLQMGRERCDQALLLISQALHTYPDRVHDCFGGRLNGADFALWLPAPALAVETAQSLGTALQATLAPLGHNVRVHLGAVEWQRGMALSQLLAQADRALAAAEACGPFAVATDEQDSDGLLDPRGGESHWRRQVTDALDHGRARLATFPVLDDRGRLLHLECPLRLQLVEGGDWEPAARWLPLAVRSRLVPEVDGRALELALQAIEADGQPRGLNVALASLADGRFAARVRHRLQETPHLAGRLWLEVDERLAVEHFERVQAFGQLVRPLGVRFGLEHAGQRLHRIDRLFELGLDYVKLDAAVCGGIASHEPARDFLRGTVTLLHTLSLKVIAEGVSQAADAQALRQCGVDAMTGPWVSREAEKATM
jgi:EAL domain-containing protein (putative c-di-GMP-specific phosphodiesterase class I)/GGDEF domain-containing protein